MKWKMITVNKQNMMQILAAVDEDAIEGNILVGAFDTETTGLHPVLDRPFLFQCGYATKQQGYTFVIDIDLFGDDAKFWIREWNRIAELFPLYAGHHVVFDLHMLTNIDCEYTADNITDSQFYIRAGSDAVATKNGGEPLALKPWSVKHLGVDANSYEKELAQERKDIAKSYNDKLKAMTGLTIKAMKEWFDDRSYDVEDYPDEWRDKYVQWFEELPAYLQRCTHGTVQSDDIRYDYLNRDNVIRYGHYDVVYTIECILYYTDIITERDNWEQVRREREQIYPLVRMERVGFIVDVDYIKECRLKMKDYLHKRRDDLVNLAGCPIKCTSYPTIKKLLCDWGYDCTDTNGEGLELLCNSIKREQGDCTATEFIENILELRTLEKWYSTYILKFLDELKRTDRIYTSIGQVATVSGRVACDFQQFPKAGIKTIDGEEIFHPRKMVICTDEYPALVYLDYSQIELRLQALYTYLLGRPDLNLCRAYEPFKCLDANGIAYRPEVDQARAYSETWYYEENPTEPWIPTDIHGATTQKAFDITPDHPDFHDLRYVGKRVNFAKNYGAGVGRIAQMFPEFGMDRIQKIDAAYYAAFPNVKFYHDVCMVWAEQPWQDNLLGVKYYGVSGHKMRNILVQGTGAYFLKEKIALVDKYLRDNHCGSKFCMQIHDELQFYWDGKDDPKIFFDIQHILQDTDMPMPIISDMEVTATNWKEKVEVHNLDEFNQVCHRD